MTDGEHTIILGADGTLLEAQPASDRSGLAQEAGGELSQEGVDALAEEAHAYLTAVRASRQKAAANPTPEMDPSVREALEALGYLQE